MTSVKSETGAPVHCPCLSGETYAACCQPFHLGAAAAPTAEKLMRSRYSAFAVRDANYLLRTWHSRARPRTLELDPDQRWYRLEILGTEGGGEHDLQGTVEFTAFSRVDAGPLKHHEVSLFVRENRRWVYRGEV